nr:hypothetical protein [Tanacetum cinerariifolium]
DSGKKVDEDPSKGGECKDQEKEDNVNNTNNVNVASTNEVKAVCANTNNELPFDLEMPALEDISTFNILNDHKDDDDEEADMNNMDTTIQVSHVATTRIHKDHPLNQVIDEAINEEMDDSLVRDATIASSSDSEQDSDEAINEEMDDSLVRAATTASSSDAEQDSGVNTPRSDKDNLKLKELMELYATLQSRVLDLEQTKATQANELDSLKRRVKKLEKNQKSRTHKLKRLYKVSLTAKVESSDDNEDLGEDASKQGRISDIDANGGITLVSTHDDDEMFDADQD